MDGRQRVLPNGVEDDDAVELEHGVEVLQCSHFLCFAMAQIDARGEEVKRGRHGPTMLVGLLCHDEAEVRARRVADKMDFVIVLIVNAMLIEIEQGCNAILAVVFGCFGIDGHDEVAMGAQAEVVHETPMEEHGRIDERAAVEVEDELARRAFMLEVLHFVTR